MTGDTVAYEFIRMPNSTGFGDYTETGQVIPVRFKTPSGEVQEGGYVHAMYLDDNSPIAGGREIWGFPKKLATPEAGPRAGDAGRHAALWLGALRHRHDGLQAPRAAARAAARAMAKPAFMIKIIPHVDCTPRICELVRYYMEDVTLKGAWSGPAALQLFEHAMCDVARLPVREVVSRQPLCRRPDARPRRGRVRLS